MLISQRNLSRQAIRVASLLFFLPSLTVVTRAQDGADGQVDFARDVLPILSDRCFHCHGPDESDRQADLRLDLEAELTADRGGYATVVPGSVDASELFDRITTTDVDRVMPPLDAQRTPLSDAEIAAIRGWIEAGAPWAKHWAFEPPRKADGLIADGGDDGKAENPIDILVRRRLGLRGLELAPEAPPEVLLRRLSFDLIGMPPTAEELDRFLADPSPAAYAQQVERLLASPHHGERMAMWWLDAARYSDTDGFQGDATRTNWPWRDWVVRAFNENLPFDRFTLEQFAGDLLPDATPEQVLATCFHRNHMTNGEGGRDPEESRIDYVIDRVNTVGTVWLGLTLGCAQCHAHKFDPISHDDYYRLFAFFNSIDEDGKAGGGAKPFLKYRSPAAEPAVDEARVWAERQEQVEQQAKREALDDFPAWLTERIASVRDGFKPWQVPDIRRVDAVEGTEVVLLEDNTIATAGPQPRQEDYLITMHPGERRVTALRLEVLADPSHTGGKYSRGRTGNFILTNVKLQIRRRGFSQVREVDLETALASVEQKVTGRNYGNVKDTLDDDPRNGWTLPEEWVAGDDVAGTDVAGDDVAGADDAAAGRSERPSPVAQFVLAQPTVVADDEELVLILQHRSTDGDANLGRFRITLTDQAGPAVRSLDPMPLEQLAVVVSAEDVQGTDEPADPDSLAQADAAEDDDEIDRIRTRIDESLEARLVDQFLQDRDDYQQAKRRADEARRHLAAVRAGAGELKVMVLGERSEPRLSHVLVRGVWDQHGASVEPGFPGAILPGEPGADSTRLDLARWLCHPEHPMTARVVVNHLWQIAFGSGLVRTPEDFGLQGEAPTYPELLDHLAVELIESGWDVRHLLRLMVTSRVYRQSSEMTPEALQADPENRWLARGPRYRLPSWMIRDAALRGAGLLNPAIGGPPVYPYQPAGVWEEIFMGRYSYHPSPGPAQYRRTLYAFWRRSSSPTFLFDSAQRRVCEVQLSRTNTPLHALTLLNDVGMLESSVALARRVIAGEPDPNRRLRFAFRQILSRDPDPGEAEVLHATWSRAAEHYANHPADAQALVAIGQGESLHADEAAEVAAYAILASSIFNLDEAMTYE